MHLEGVIPPMATPIREDAVATGVLRSHTNFLREAGVHGLFPCGSTGEFTALTPEQRARVVRTVCEQSGSVPVLAGCGGTSVRTVRSHVERAADAGADAAVVITPYYTKSTQSGLRSFFTQVAGDSPLPIVLYEIPALTGQRLTPESIATLAEQDAIVGLKDSTGDLRRLLSILEATPESFDVLQGATELGLATLDLGGDGLVAGPANVYPGAMVECYRAHRDGDYERARQIANEVANPVVSACDPMPLPAAIKHLLRRRGFDAGPPLPPIAPLEDAERDRLDRCYERIDAGPLSVAEP